MIEHGFNNDELEKQLQEEEAKLGTNPEEKKNNETLKETTENVVEKDLSIEAESLEKNTDIVQKNIEEIGGSEVINQVLNKMSPEKLADFNKKIEEKKKSIEEKIRTLKNGNGIVDGMWDITKWMATGDTFTIEKNDYFIDKLRDASGNIMGVPLGISFIPIIGPFKGIQQIIRKIKIASEKRGLAKMEKEVV